MACLSAELSMPDSPAYRRGAGHGLTMGSLTVPAVIFSLMLRQATATGKRDVLLAFYMRMAVSMSFVHFVDAARRPIQRTREVGSAWTWIMGTILSLSLLVHANFMGVPFMLAAVIMGGSLALFRGLLRGCGRAFTLGEATAISTGLSLLVVDTGAQVLAVASGEVNPLVRKMLHVDCIAQCLVAGTLITSLALWPWVLPPIPVGKDKKEGTRANDGKEAKMPGGAGGNRTFRFAAVLVCVVGFVCMPAATLMVGKHMLVWVGEHVLGGGWPRRALLAYWGSTLALTLIAFPREGGGLPKIVVRKGFHIVAVLLFAPGQWLEPETMRLAYAASFALLVTLEMARAARLGALSEFLQRSVVRTLP